MDTTLRGPASPTRSANNHRTAFTLWSSTITRDRTIPGLLDGGGLKFYFSWGVVTPKFFVFHSRQLIYSRVGYSGAVIRGQFLAPPKPWGVAPARCMDTTHRSGFAYSRIAATSRDVNLQALGLFSRAAKQSGPWMYQEPAGA